jgi:ATP-dependent exoDNAse (exonuclease V) beta subunit
MNNSRQHISFSELKIWKECPHKRKLIYEDKLKGFQGNIYTAFGTAVHLACEKGYTDDLKAEQRQKVFLEAFERESNKLNLDRNKDWNAFQKQGLVLSVDAVETTKRHFPGWEVFSAEEMIYESIKEKDYNFKGIVDLILKKGDKYILIDWKTCTWGWDARRKSDKMTVYQLSYYKNFFSQKYNIPLKNVETYFILLKRTAKKNIVELLKVTNGQKRLDNSMKLLNNAIININNRMNIKNRLSCAYCEFKKTEHCP